MSNLSNWTFNNQDEDKMPFWTIEWGDSEELMLVIWPEIRSNGTATFSYGYMSTDNAEFEQVGYALGLVEAKEQCVLWGSLNDPKNV